MVTSHTYFFGFLTKFAEANIKYFYTPLLSNQRDIDILTFLDFQLFS